MDNLRQAIHQDNDMMNILPVTSWLIAKTNFGKQKEKEVTKGKDVRNKKTHL